MNQRTNELLVQEDCMNMNSRVIDQRGRPRATCLAVLPCLTAVRPVQAAAMSCQS